MQNIDPVLLRPIDELSITASTAQLLKAANIYYIGDLVQRTQAELVTQRNLPSGAVVEIRIALWSRGLDLTKD